MQSPNMTIWINFDQVGIGGMVVWMKEQCDVGLCIRMRLHHCCDIDIEQRIAIHDKKLLREPRHYR